ncbi:hypothetical protein RND81_05G118200 [Saponaria officinalis]|uniref:non-specific serine/threonine protein kinase n=1 Tax=Saponaria officinalis TaxID=3572 RepID=A0AAW1KZZ6_SAPOF
MTNLTWLGAGGNQLVGVLPPSIFNLSSLVLLEVLGNNFKGSLPPFTGLKFPQLQVLNLNANYFSGTLPIVAHAINYLHHEPQTPIVHCDLKPSNILLDQDMVAHVGDFGLAKFLARPPHPNQSSSIAIRGTVGYAAPGNGINISFETINNCMNALNSPLYLFLLISIS